MKIIFPYVVGIQLVLLILIGCSRDISSSKKPHEASIKVEKGEINVLKNGDCVVKFQGTTSVFKNVRTFILFNSDPYFELDDGRIIKWNVTLSNNALNLQKVWDGLYFIRQYGEGASLEGTSINMIDKNGKIHEMILRQNGNSFITENYGVFNDRYIVENSERGFCIADKKGKVITCYPWPK